MVSRGFEDLKVWQKSIDLAESIYVITKNFPVEERYGLMSQMRRSVVSVSSNIAEGAERSGEKSFSNFLSIAHGSLAELKTQLIIAQRIGFINNDNFEEKRSNIEEISRMLRGLQRSVAA